MNTKIENDNSNKFLAQNIDIEDLSDSIVIDSFDEQDEVDSLILDLKSDKTFQQCSSAGNIYSDEELNENLQELK